MALLLGFLITAVLMPGLIAAAWRMGWVARPRSDRWHRRPTALMGGIPMLVGICLAGMSAGLERPGWALLGGGFVMFLVGVIDDRILELNPPQKLVAQGLVAFYLVSEGYVPTGLPFWIGAPLAFLWLVGITNAINLLDNMDGLAAGVTALIALTLAVLHGLDSSSGLLCMAVAGACLAFLIYNLHPARVFMGDCGSMLLGTLVGGLGLSLLSERSAVATALALPLVVFVVPLWETLLVVFARARAGRPVLPGAIDHASHRFVLGGMTERQAVAAHLAIGLAGGTLGLAWSRMPAAAAAGAAAALVAVLGVASRHLLRQPVYEQPRRQPEPFFTVSQAVPWQRSLQDAVIDAGIAAFSFTAAHWLRMECTLPPSFAEEIVRALPVVIVCRVSGLFLCRAYQRRPGDPAAAVPLKAALGSLIGSTAQAILISVLFGFLNLSRAALIIDGMLFLLLAVLVRSLGPVFGYLQTGLGKRSGLRVLVLGAGAEAFEWTVRLRHPLAGLRSELVGILADDSETIQGDVNGVPVAHGMHMLEEVMARHQVQCCLLGVHAESSAGMAILERCRAAGVVVSSSPGESPTAAPGEPAAAAG